MDVDSNEPTDIKSLAKRLRSEGKDIENSNYSDELLHVDDIGEVFSADMKKSLQAILFHPPVQRLREF